MTRSTKADKARQLNAAYGLLASGTPLPDAAQALSQQFALSLRQAYRYLEQAGTLAHPVEVVEATAAITLKLPPRIIGLLHAHSRRSGLTLGEIVARALTSFLDAVGRHG